MMSTERVFRRGLILVALGALAFGLAIWGLGHAVAARWIWAFGTLAVSITRDFLAGRVGVDAIALVSMSATLLLGETLADVVVAVYAGGNVLEDFAVARTERNLKSLVDRRGWRTGAANAASRTSRSSRWRSATPSWCASARSSRSRA